MNSMARRSERVIRLSTTRGNVGRILMVRVLSHVTLVVISAIFLFPLLWMVSSSLKSTGEIFSPGLNLIPAHPTLENYRVAFNSLGYNHREP